MRDGASAKSVIALVDRLPVQHRTQYEMLVHACQSVPSFGHIIPNNDAFVLWPRCTPLEVGLDDLAYQHAPLNRLNIHVAGAFEAGIERAHEIRPSIITSQLLELMRRWRCQVDLENHYLGHQFAMKITEVMRQGELESAAPETALFDDLLAQLPDRILSQFKLSVLIRTGEIGSPLFARLDDALCQVKWDRLEIQKTRSGANGMNDTVSVAAIFHNAAGPSWPRINDVVMSAGSVGCLRIEPGISVSRAVKIGPYVLLSQGYNGLKNLLQVIGSLDRFYSAVSGHALRTDLPWDGVV